MTVPRIAAGTLGGRHDLKEHAVVLRRHPIERVGGYARRCSSNAGSFTAFVQRGRDLDEGHCGATVTRRIRRDEEQIQGPHS